jgi:hypothetical protein
MESKLKIISNCRLLLDVYRLGELGYMVMPEDSSPAFSDEEQEARLTYFTLPMSLNYQRDNYKLWESALKTFNDSETKIVFDIQSSAKLNEIKLREYLIRHKVALQPNKHITTWQKIAKTISENWGSMDNFFRATDYDFLKLKEVVQRQFKSGFPYLSGPKIFNYWSFVIQQYGKVKLKNSEFIEIAPDTHITKYSIVLGVLTKEEAESFTKERISERWRELLDGTGINPIDMHPPLWFWCRRQDSNLHPYWDTSLKRTCLPVPSLRLTMLVFVMKNNYFITILSLIILRFSSVFVKNIILLPNSNFLLTLYI